MERIKPKIPGMIALAVSVVSCVFLVGSVISSITEPPVEEGLSGAFALWVYAVIFAIISIVFYLTDAVMCIRKTFGEKLDVLDAVLIFWVFGSIPMVIFVGGALGINILIWNVYYLAMYLLETVSVVRWIKRK